MPPAQNGRMIVAASWVEIGTAATGVAVLILALLAFLGIQTLPELAKATPLTRRRWLERQLRKIGVGVRVGYVTALLGSPTFTRGIDAQSLSDKPEEGHVSRPATEVIYALQDAFVQLVAVGDADLDDRPVALLAVTLRDLRFRPRLRNRSVFADRRGKPALQLGRTTFATLERIVGAPPSGLHGWLGARRWGWAESYYFGNPGGYQTFIVALNDAGPSLFGTFPRQASAWQAGAFGPAGQSAVMSQVHDPAVMEWREKTAVNTYIVLAQDVTPREALHWGLGPDLDRVRLLPS